MIIVFLANASLAEGSRRFDERSVRRNLKSLEANGLLAIQRRGLGKTNVYELNLTATSDARSRADKNVRSRKAQ